jgi:choline dehydrogenase-like flavoprotein
MSAAWADFRRRKPNDRELTAGERARVAFYDLNIVEGSPFAESYDVCVCGSGPAGVTAARELAVRGVRVLLLEAGGLELTSDSQDIYETQSIGALTYWGANGCRLRMFGGTSNHWSGRCGVLDEIDFEPRDIWDVPGWPIGRTDAYRRLDDAREILDIADQSLERRSEPHWRSGRFAPAAFARSAPTRFGEKYRAELTDAVRIDVVINANALGAALTGDGGGVEHLSVSDYRDRRFAVRARHFVLALGALENARFLMNAAAATGAPFGDQGGFVGRCFMEHFDIPLGRFASFDAPLWERDAPVSLNPTVEVLNRQSLGSAVISMTPAAKPRFYGRLAPLRRFANDFQCATQSWLPQGQAKRTTFCRGDGIVSNIIEQVPNPDSRATLDRTKKDRFGQFRLNIDWRLAAQDRATIRGLAEEVGKALAEQDVARFQISNAILDDRPEPGHHCHQMGTTRMSADPKFGVVDRNQKLHGLRNLHVAGSSVFSTGGGVNPTLTIVALSLRLGEHPAGLVAAGK